MSVSLPDGATLAIATTYGSPKTVTAITNANNAVASSASHGILTGAPVLVSSGWQKINDRVFKAGTVAAGTLELAGANTTNTTSYPAGSGIGTVTEITAWTQITQILEFSTQGGDQQFANYSFLEEDFERQVPSMVSAQSIQLGIADDPTLAGYIALQTAAEARAVRAIRLSLPNGSTLFYNGFVSFNPTPTMSKGALMQVRANISLTSRPVRY